MLPAEQMSLERAYRVLGVPQEASAHTIKLDSPIALSIEISLKLWLAGVALGTLGFAYLAARMGDKFWYSLLEKWFD